jgi:hypothetical protein
MKCRTCNKKIPKPFPEGTTQIGRGNHKSLLTFCKKECLDKYDKYKSKGWLWRLKGTTPLHGSSNLNKGSQDES